MNLISKILTNIRNAKKAKLNYIQYDINQKEMLMNIVNVLTILRNNGVIRAFSILPSINMGKSKLVIYMKYDHLGGSVIRSIFSISKPSRKLYLSSKSLWQPQSTTGFFVLSTSYGIITEMDARRYNVGGCILFGIT